MWLEDLQNVSTDKCPVNTGAVGRRAIRSLCSPGLPGPDPDEGSSFTIQSRSPRTSRASRDAPGRRREGANP